MTIEIYRDSHLYELPDDLRGRLRSAIMTKCQCHRTVPMAVPDQSSVTPADSARRPSELRVLSYSSSVELIGLACLPDRAVSAHPPTNFTLDEKPLCLRGPSN